MIDNRVRFVVVGFGHIGKRHADMVSRNEECELVAVVDTDAAIAAQVAAIYNVPFFTSWHDFKSSGIQADVANIATPNGLHAANAIEAIESGCHVVIEKPLALTTADCDAVLECVKKNGRQVFCVMQNRYSPPMQWLKELLSDAVLGRVYIVDVHCYWNRDSRYYTGDTWKGTDNLDGGTLFTQFSHYVDLVYWLFGDLQNISARFNNFNHNGVIGFEDSATVIFDTAAGANGTISYTTSVWDKNMESTLVVIGEKGTVKIGGQYMDKVEYCHIKDYNMEDGLTGEAMQLSGYSDAKANHYYVIQNVVDVLKSRSAITTTAEEGAKVVDIIERIYSLKK